MEVSKIIKRLSAAQYIVDCYEMACDDKKEKKEARKVSKALTEAIKYIEYEEEYGYN